MGIYLVIFQWNEDRFDQMVYKVSGSSRSLKFSQKGIIHLSITVQMQDCWGAGSPLQLLIGERQVTPWIGASQEQTSMYLISWQSMSVVPLYHTTQESALSNEINMNPFISLVVPLHHLCYSSYLFYQCAESHVLDARLPSLVQGWNSMVRHRYWITIYHLTVCVKVCAVTEIT